jgi:hypothetical protein
MLYSGMNWTILYADEFVPEIGRLSPAARI